MGFQLSAEFGPVPPSCNTLEEYMIISRNAVGSQTKGTFATPPVDAAARLYLVRVTAVH